MHAYLKPRLPRRSRVDDTLCPACVYFIYTYRERITCYVRERQEKNHRAEGQHSSVWPFSSGVNFICEYIPEISRASYVLYACRLTLASHAPPRVDELYDADGISGRGGSPSKGCRRCVSHVFGRRVMNFRSLEKELLGGAAGFTRCSRSPFFFISVGECVKSFNTS